jgi:hypothetical protein
MDSASVKEIVANELSRGDGFDNWHGITAANISEFLVEPFPVIIIEPDDPETAPCEMWVVLQETPNPTRGYVIVFDPNTRSWAVADHVANGKYEVDAWGNTLAEALTDM